MMVTCGVESAPHLPFHRARPLCRALTFPETDMADFFTHFSCVLDVGTPDNVARALDLYQGFTEDAAREDVPSDGFLLSIQPEHGGTTLWIRHEVTGDPHQVILFVQRAPGTFV